MENTKNREWVKNAAIIFLVVLLVLTFFSNTIMNRSLPEVATQSVISGSIVARVRGTGTVTANGTNQVKMQSTRQIRSVMIKTGQKVEAGDVLFTLGQGTSEDIAAAEERLMTLQSNYNRTAASIPYYSYNAENVRLSQAAVALKEAEDEMNAAYEAAKQASASSGQGLVDRIEDAKKAEFEAKTVLKEKVQAVLDAENAVKEEEAKRLSPEQFQAYLDELYDLINSQPSSDEIFLLQQQIFNLEMAIAEKEALAESLDELLEEQHVLTKDPSVAIEPDNNEKLNQQIRDLLQKIEEAQKAKEDLPGMYADLGTLKAELDAKQRALPEDHSDRIDWLEYIIAASQNDTVLEELRKALEEAIAAQNAAEEDYEKKAAYLALLDEADDGIPQTAIYKQKKKAYDEAYLNYVTIQDNLQDMISSNERAATAAYIDLEGLNQQIESAKKKLAELLGGDENTINAPVAGTVLSVDVNAGDTKSKGDILCTLEVPDMGYSLSFSVTNDQANRLRPGDTATVSNFYWGNEIVATLNNIKVDPKNPQSNKLLTFDLDGNVTAGQELTISVGQKSANYDLIIPSSAIRTDSNGSFVLRVDAKNSPLGNRYIARRVGVEVLASDDTNSAVTADLNNGDYVITTSSAPVKSGDLVRLSNY